MGTLPRGMCGCRDRRHRIDVSGPRPFGRTAGQARAHQRSGALDRSGIHRHVTLVTLLRRTTGYAFLHRWPERPADLGRQLMSNNSPQSSTEPFAILASSTPDAPRQEPDSEDRRWQLEWARRNVED